MGSPPPTRFYLVGQLTNRCSTKKVSYTGNDYKPFANVLLFFRLKWFRPQWWIITGVRLQSKAGGGGISFLTFHVLGDLCALWLVHGELNTHVKILAPHLNEFRVDEPYWCTLHGDTWYVWSTRARVRHLQTVFLGSSVSIEARDAIPY